MIMNLKVRIVQCTAGVGTWYESRIGHTVSVFAVDQYGYWTRDTGPLNLAQWIKVMDAEVTSSGTAVATHQ